MVTEVIVRLRERSIDNCFWPPYLSNRITQRDDVYRLREDVVVHEFTLAINSNNNVRTYYVKINEISNTPR